MSLDPRIAHTIDARALLALLPHVDQGDLRQIRQEFARFIEQSARRGVEHATWQAAWNAFTGISHGGHGLIEYRTLRCPDCRNGLSTRRIGHNIARTGQPYACGTCRGTGRGQFVRQTALRAPEPSGA